MGAGAGGESLKTWRVSSLAYARAKQLRDLVSKSMEGEDWPSDPHAMAHMCPHLHTETHQEEKGGGRRGGKRRGGGEEEEL